MVSVLRGSLFLLGGAVLMLLPLDFLTQIEVTGGRAAAIVGGIVLIIVGGLDIGLGLAVFFGRNWARILVMLTSVFAVLTAFISNADRSEVITLGTLPTVSISILVLLALSSHRARDYALSRRHQPKRLAGRPRDQLTV